MASSSSLLSQINDDYLTCQICMEPYQTPKVLNCLHTFCKNCLDLCEKSAHETYILCPLCRQQTTLGMKGVDGLKNNFVLSNMSSMMKDWKTTRTREDGADEDVELCQTCPADMNTIATHQCINCLDLLCVDCAAFHNRTKLTKEHKVATLEEIKSGKYRDQIRKEEMSRCVKHKDLKTEHYCCDCSEAVCKDCIIENHQSHLLFPADKGLKMVKDEVESIKEKMELIISSSKKALLQLKSVEEEEQLVKQQIQQAVEDFVEAIKKKETELLTIAEEIQTENHEQISFITDYLENQMKCMKNCTDLSNCLMQNGTVREILQVKEKMKETINHLEEVSRDAINTNERSIQHMRYIPKNVTAMAITGMGSIQKEEEAISTLIEWHVLSKELSNVDETLHRQVKRRSEYNYKKSPCSSSSAKHKSMPNEVLFVDLPSHNDKMPVPKPRKNNTTLSQNSNLENTRNTFQENKSKMKLLNNEIKPSVKQTKPLPTPKGREQSSYQSSTIPRTRNHEKIYPSRMKTNKTSEQNNTTNTLHADARSVSQSTIYRVAPKPPDVALKPISKAKKCMEVSKCKSPKKSFAPLPPNISTGGTVYKASFVKALDVQSCNYEFTNGIAITKTNILALDVNIQQVIVFDKEGFYARQFQVKNPIQANKNEPTGLTVSLSDEIYVLYANVVTVWSMRGAFLHCFGQDNLLNAQGIAIDSRGRVITVDEERQEITIFSQGGNYVSSITKYLCKPRYICVTSRDEIVVSDSNYNVVMIFNANGFLAATCKSNETTVKLPKGIAAIRENSSNTELILIADQANNRISAYNCHGKFLYHVLECHRESSFKNPEHIVISKDQKQMLLLNDSKKVFFFKLQAAASNVV